MNGPLESLARKLRGLQRDAEAALVSARSRKESPKPSTTPPGRLSIEPQVSRIVSAILERLQIPTRAEISDLSERVAQLEKSITLLSKSVDPVTRAANPSKTRRRSSR